MKTLTQVALATLFLSLPGFVSALTMLDPGGSAVNPIYVQDATPPQLKKPAEPPTYPRRTLQELQTTPTPAAPIFVPAPPPTIIYVNNPAPTSCPAGYLLINGSCLTYDQSCQQKYGPNTYGDATTCSCFSGYQWNSDNSACIAIPVVVSTAPAGGSGSAVPIAPKTSVCPKGQARTTDGSCASYQRACVIDFGPHSTWTGNLNETGGGICGCEEGYQTNLETKSCVAVPDQAAAVAVGIESMDAPKPNWWQRFLSWLGL